MKIPRRVCTAKLKLKDRRIELSLLSDNSWHMVFKSLVFDYEKKHTINFERLKLSDEAMDAVFQMYQRIKINLQWKK